MIQIGINEGIGSSVVFASSGKILFALQEERVRRVKEFSGFPDFALEFGMRYLDLSPSDIDEVLLSNLKSEHPIYSRKVYLVQADRKYYRSYRGVVARQFIKAALGKRAIALGRLLVGKKSIPSEGLDDYISRKYNLGNKALFKFDHHTNHAASAYFGCRQDPGNKHLILTLDGGGDGLCATISIGENGKLQRISKSGEGHSIGNIWSYVTHHMGMRPHEHEYKLMGLAPYAEVKYIEPVRTLFESYLTLDPSDKLQFKRLVPESTSELGPRLRKDLVRVRFDSIAGGLQAFTEDLVLQWVQEAVARTGIRRVLCAGGVFMNVKLNKILAERVDLEYFDVFPSCGDETLPFGSIWHSFAENDPKRAAEIKLDGFYLGPSPEYDFDEAVRSLPTNVKMEKLEDPESTVAGLLAERNIVARCSGRMEFGARALGNRSILADAANPQTVPTINKMIKKRDFWMPFAPAMLHESLDRYIVRSKTLPQCCSPYMMHTFDTTENRNDFIGGVHAYDHTARAQSVDLGRNPEFHRLISIFAEKTGSSVVLNTSFNLHGFPIVMGTKDALEVFVNSELPYLVVQNHLFSKGAG